MWLDAGKAEEIMTEAEFEEKLRSKNIYIERLEGRVSRLEQDNYKLDERATTLKWIIGFTVLMIVWTSFQRGC